MPNPFNREKSQTSTPGMVEITNSVLICDTCFHEATNGLYDPKDKVLMFVCPAGHQNIVKGIEL